MGNVGGMRQVADTSRKRQSTERAGETAGTEKKAGRSRKSPAAKKAEETLNEKKSGGKKKASSGKGTAKGTGSRSRASQAPEPVEKSGTGAFMGTEVAIIVSFAISVLLFLSNFGLCGFVGSFLRSTLLGVFGVMGYLVPFLLFMFFAEQNGHSAPLTAGIKLRAKVVGGDAPSKAFLAATNRVGLAFNYDGLQLSDYRISCVGTALKLYNQMGEKIYCEALRLIVAAWGGKPDSFRASVLRGMMHFVELYHGEFSEERLVRALGSVHPMEIYRVGRDNPAKLPGWKKYVFPIYMAYIGKGRKDALPMKF